MKFNESDTFYVECDSDFLFKIKEEKWGNNTFEHESCPFRHDSLNDEIGHDKFIW